MNLSPTLTESSEEPRSCAASRRMPRAPCFAAILRDASASPMFLADALDTQVKPAYDAKSAAAPCATACAWASRHMFRHGRALSRLRPGHDELGDSRLGERSSARPMIAASRLTSRCPVTSPRHARASSRASTSSTRGQDVDAQQLGFAELRSKSRPKPETSGLGDEARP